MRIAGSISRGKHVSVIGRGTQGAALIGFNRSVFIRGFGTGIDILPDVFWKRQHGCRLCGAGEAEWEPGKYAPRYFGVIALLVFLIAQACDGVFTYVGVSTYGPHIEANPLIGWLMTTIGQGAALATAKGAAGALRDRAPSLAVHRVVARWRCSIIAVAVLPWIARPVLLN